MEQNFNEENIQSENTFAKSLASEVVRENVGTKLLIISLLCLLLLVPWIFIRSTIEERRSTESNAEQEVFSKWGGEQMVKGPAIRVEDSTEFVLLPESLEIVSNAGCQNLSRGIYDFTVYDATVDMKGHFALPNDLSDKEYSSLSRNCWNMEVELTTLKGLTDTPVIKINGKELDVNDVRFEGSRLMWRCDLDSMLNGGNMSYEIRIKIRGSNSLNFLPTGNTTTVKMTSDCPTPSFCGNFLPTERNVRDDGFDAEWKVLAINRSFSQKVAGSVWESINLDNVSCLVEDNTMDGDGFGVELRLPVEQYQQNVRVVKYAYLFVLLTFAIVFFMELRRKCPIHPVQYLLVGIAIMLFYTLLLSFSEHLSFLVAYIIATVMTVAMLSLYLGSIMHDRRIGLLIGGILSVCYVFIYILLQIESYALLIGSIGLFVVLAVAMAASRKVDWYKNR